jgi:hypothetical protein
VAVDVVAAPGEHHVHAVRGGQGDVLVEHRQVVGVAGVDRVGGEAAHDHVALPRRQGRDRSSFGVHLQVPLAAQDVRAAQDDLLAWCRR